MQIDHRVATTRYETEKASAKKKEANLQGGTKYELNSMAPRMAVAVDPSTFLVTVEASFGKTASETREKLQNKHLPKVWFLEFWKTSGFPYLPVVARSLVL